MPKNSAPAVIFDRDGTLIVDKHYLHDPCQVELLPDVVSGLQLLQRAGFRLFVATNQSGIGRGYYTEKTMHAVHAKLSALLAEENIFLQGFYHCPHAPQEPCTCRKPRLGMLRQIHADHSIEAHKCFVVGDKACDILLASAAHMRSVLVRTGYGKETEKAHACAPCAVVDSLHDAAIWIEQALI